MSKIIIAMQTAVAHIHPTFRIARELKKRGHSVTYVSHTRWLESYVKEQGFSHYQLDLGISPAQLRKAPVCRGNWLPARMRKAIHESDSVIEALKSGKYLLAMLDALAPDLVLIDSTASLFALPLAIWGIPLLMISPVLPLDREPNVPPLTSHLVPSTSRLSRIRCGIAWRGHMIKKLLLSAADGLIGLSDRQRWRTVAHHYGVAVADVMDKNRSWPSLRRPELILCPEAFDFPRARRPNRTFVDSSVRPETTQASNPGSFPWERILGDKPLVYCSFGSRVPAQWKAKRILAEIIQAFATQNRIQIVVKVETKYEVTEFIWAPAHVIVVHDWMPQLAVLNRAVAHITHAGFMSVRESIEQGVPMLAIPFDSDQPGNAARIAFHNLGIRILPRSASGSKVLKMTNKLIDSPVYRTSVCEMKSIFDEQRKRCSAADAIELFLREGSSD